MSHTNPLTGARYPDSTDNPNVNQDIQNAVNDLSSVTVPRFTSTGARGTAASNWVAQGNTMGDMMLAAVGSKLYGYNTAASAWVELLDTAGFTAFTPTWTASGTAPSVGNGSLAGRYRKIGRVCHFNMILTFGSTTNGGFGSYTFAGLPFTSANYEQEVLAKCVSTGGGTREWSGYAWIPSSTNQMIPRFSNSAAPPYMEPVRQSDASNTNGTGIPFISGQFPFGNGANIIVQGSYETAS